MDMAQRGQSRAGPASESNHRSRLTGNAPLQARQVGRAKKQTPLLSILALLFLFLIALVIFFDWLLLRL